jgi:poly-gamma-glutamate synthesis protein (capsule biosynthesis protein)
MLRFENGYEEFRKPKSYEKITLAVAGDCCPWQDTITDISAGKSSEILKAVQPFLDKSDLSIVQWESPLTNSVTPKAKSGATVKCPPECVEFIKAAGFDVALLANNHIGDFGSESVIETIDILNKKDIKHVGAGKNITDAAKPLFLQRRGFKIGIVNIAEHEFGIAANDKAGFAPLEPLETIKIIKAVSEKTDICLVIVHGGNEYNPIPSPRMVRNSRAFAEAGADAVINIHTHCPQGIELWKGVPIIYSTGNFFFPSPWMNFKRQDFWWTGYLPRISFDKKGAFSIEITPYTFSPNPWKIEPFDRKRKGNFCKYLAIISAIIENDGELHEYFDAWCLQMGSATISLIKNLVSSWPIDYTVDSQVEKMLPLRNLLTCEAHSEMISNFIQMIVEYRIADAKKYSKKLQKLRIADFDTDIWNSRNRN